MFCFHIESTFSSSIWPLNFDFTCGDYWNYSKSLTRLALPLRILLVDCKTDWGLRFLKLLIARIQLHKSYSESQVKINLLSPLKRSCYLQLHEKYFCMGDLLTPNSFVVSLNLMDTACPYTTCCLEFPFAVCHFKGLRDKL
jgi:hypothetical protein